MVVCKTIETVSYIYLIVKLFARRVTGENKEEGDFYESVNNYPFLKVLSHVHCLLLIRFIYNYFRSKLKGYLVQNQSLVQKETEKLTKKLKNEVIDYKIIY